MIRKFVTSDLKDPTECVVKCEVSEDESDTKIDWRNGGCQVCMGSHCTVAHADYVKSILDTAVDYISGFVEEFKKLNLSKRN